MMVGAWLFLRETMRWERWVATGIGFAGVLIVLAPKLSGGSGIYHLVMLASAPVFATSFLITKALTRYESPGVIVLWQAISVTLFSLPMALWTWQTPTAWQWAGFALSGVLGSAGHYCLTRSFTLADISSSQSVKFLDLVWAALLGGLVICAAALWVGRRESRRVVLV